MKKPHLPLGKCGFWQRMRDSNPRKRSQSPVCYRYTNPLFCWPLVFAHKQHGYYSTENENVKQYFSLFQKIFHPGNPWPGRGKYVPKMRENEKSSCKMEMGMVLLICNILERPGLGSFGSF